MDSQDEKALGELGDILVRFGKAMISIGGKLARAAAPQQSLFVTPSRKNGGADRKAWLKRMIEIKAGTPKAFDKVVKDLGYQTEEQLADLQREMEEVGG